MRARRVTVVLILAATLLAACRVDATVGVELHHDGSGRVRMRVALDDDARSRVPLASINLDDLRAAGWHVTRDASSITIDKPFARVVDLGATLRELTGSSGLVRVVSATRTPSFFATHFAVRVDVDLRELLAGVPADTDLANRLRVVGLDPAALELQLDGPLRQAVGVQLVMALPDGRVRTWTVPAGGHVDARATSSVANGPRVTWFLAAVALAGAALVLVAIAYVPPGRRRRRRR
ncbi:MAG: hypothetical protein JOZ99_01295, partial [Actinobacteria bacterium]|nr:hypothetical protein [Actinomycetota bacterium]